MAEEKKQEEKKQEEKKQEAPKAKASQGAQAQPKAEAPKKAPAKDEGKEKPDIKLTAKMKDIMSSIEGMTVLELSDLVKALEDKFGVTAAQPVIAAAAAAPGAAPAEEKTSFTVG